MLTYDNAVIFCFLSTEIYFLLVLSNYLTFALKSLNLKLNKMQHQHITEEQKKMMIEYMKHHEELQSGKFSNKFSYRDAQAQWSEITDILNSIPGAKKNWKNWRKTWQDLKSRTKTKAGSIRVHAKGTGGGPPCIDKITEMEEEILSCIKPVCIEGHRETSESLAEFDFSGINEISELADEIVENNTSIPRKSQFSVINVQPSTSSTKESISIMREGLSTSKPLTISNKIPRKKNSAKNDTLEAVADYKCSIKAKLQAKENYYAKKLALLERVTVAKEKNVSIAERIATALEIIADSIS